MKKISYAVSLCVLGLVGCDSIYPPTPHPDYAIRVQPSPSGGTATAQPCASWETQNANPFDNQPEPQFGCSDKQNLAAQVERPNDLVQGRPLGATRGVALVGSVRRYDNNQTRGLITTGQEENQVATSTAPATASAMTGDATGGAGATAATTASTSSSTP